MRRIHAPKTRTQLRYRRHLRVRSKVAGTAERPRLVVFRSLKHIYAQLVDDDRGVTLLGVSDASEGIAADGAGKVARGKAVGQAAGGEGEGGGIQPGGVRPRRLPLPWSRPGGGRGRPRRRIGVLMADETTQSGGQAHGDRRRPRPPRPSSRAAAEQRSGGGPAPRPGRARR